MHILYMGYQQYLEHLCLGCLYINLADNVNILDIIAMATHTPGNGGLDPEAGADEVASNAEA